MSGNNAAWGREETPEGDSDANGHGTSAGAAGADSELHIEPHQAAQLHFKLQCYDGLPGCRTTPICMCAAQVAAVRPPGTPGRCGCRLLVRALGRAPDLGEPSGTAAGAGAPRGVAPPREGVALVGRRRTDCRRCPRMAKRAGSVVAGASRGVGPSMKNGLKRTSSCTRPSRWSCRACSDRCWYVLGQR